jgi:hypothetical protein
MTEFVCHTLKIAGLASRAGQSQVSSARHREFVGICVSRTIEEVADVADPTGM